ncbi:hypothetical protein [Methylomarinum vadi]|uniref:hypothetical protein n=1 Tax=Methylomarinum vadi TaxID=438855 RepID=UPI0004DF41A0|nr:hypothetical protein [Methylomarinum vadi]
MTKLSLIETEARRRLGRFPEQKLEALQREVIELCEEHWSLIRGPEPFSGLTRALWTVRPHLVDLFVDLYGSYDAKLSVTFSNLPPIKVLAALVLAEIEHGNAEGARLAYEAMMLFETEEASEIYIDSVRTRLRGVRPNRAKWHKHEHHDALFRSLAFISEQTGRSDLQAIIVALEYLSAVQASRTAKEHPGEEEKILEFLQNLDLVLRGFEADKLHYTLRGTARKPVSTKRLEDMLARIRGNP